MCVAQKHDKVLANLGQPLLKDGLMPRVEECCCTQRKGHVEASILASTAISTWAAEPGLQMSTASSMQLIWLPDSSVRAC